VRVEDVDKINDMIKDMRLFMTKYDKVIGQLHKRVFLDKVTRDQISIYMSCYLSAPNRDAFMNYKQELFLGLLSVIKAHGAKLARNYLNVRPLSLTSPFYAWVHCRNAWVFVSVDFVSCSSVLVKPIDWWLGWSIPYIQVKGNFTTEALFVLAYFLMHVVDQAMRSPLGTA
jgi:hypothetical protein